MKCIEVVAQLLHDKDKRLRLAAAQTLLDRGFGRPATHITTDGEANITMLHRLACQSAGIALQSEAELRVTSAPRPVEPKLIDLTLPPAE